MYLLHLMTQWAVVADVWFLEPQFIQPNETAIEFAERWAVPTVHTAVHSRLRVGSALD